jgi:hypothetical protein
MIKWIRDNTWVFSIIGPLVLVIAAAAVAYNQLSGLVEQQSQVQQHIHDHVRHIDVTRDPQALKQLTDRIEKLEAKLERLEGRGRWGRSNYNDTRRPDRKN